MDHARAKKKKDSGRMESASDDGSTRSPSTDNDLPVEDSFVEEFTV